MQEYNICFSLDTTYTEQLAVSIASILKNADVKDNINFYILDGGLTKSDKTQIELLKNIKTFCIEYIPVDSKDFAKLPLLKEKDDSHKDYHVTLPTYYRFKLAQLLPSLKKVLYFDCDVIVRSSLKELYNIDLKNTAVAMALDAESEKEAERLKLKNYFNAGVMLINLEYWRKNNVEQKLFDFALKNRDIILWQDQDIINSVLAENIKKLDNFWNYQYFLYENIDNNSLSGCNIFHLAGRFKPWLLPFEHTIYEYYYYYLSFTPWKNRIVEYRQKAFGKHLKNNTGGSVTNIVVNATNEDLQKVYDEIDSNYAYTNEQLDLVKKERDVKITAIYDEITKNYDYTKSLVDDSNFKSEESRKQLECKIEELMQNAENSENVKISEIYAEISKNYDYTNNLSDNLKNEIYSLNLSTEEGLKNKIQENYNNTEMKISNIYDEIAKAHTLNQQTLQEVKINIENETNTKIDDVYDEITKNYEFTKEKIKEAVFNSEQNNDSKITQVYEEITKNYEYTNSLAEKSADKTEEVKSLLLQNIAENTVKVYADTDEKISSVYDEISKNYKYTDEKVSDIYGEISKSNQNTDEKISDIYEELNKNNQYTDELFQEADKKADILNTEVAEIKSDIDKILNDEIAGLSDKISCNAQYTDFLVKSVEEKQNQLRIDAVNEINSSINVLKHEEDEKLNNALNDLSVSTEEKIRILDEVFSERIDSVSSQINKETNLKFSEIYAYTNEQASRLFKELKDSNSKIENNLNGRIYDLYKNNELVKSDISRILKNMEDKSDKTELSVVEQSFKQELESYDSNYNLKLAEMKSQFEAELNSQRIKYENKLITMENKLEHMEAYMRKSAFAKFVDKLRKTKNR